MGFAARARFEWKLKRRSLILGERTLVMGIVNRTPDSFSDGGERATLGEAVDHAVAMLDTGADIIDVGGESTRPGATAGTREAISTEEEQSRVLPLIHALKETRRDVVISVDTYRAATARAAVAAGAEIVNDVSGMQWDPAMAGTCAALGCGVVAMHTRGLPSAWASQPRLQATEVLPLVLSGLRSTAAQLMLAGCERSSIVLDPGFGFGKLGDENWTLLRELETLHTLKFPLLAGMSRKGFLRSAIESGSADEPRMRDSATAAACVAAVLAGVHVVRAHHVALTREAVAVADAIRGGAR